MKKIMRGAVAAGAIAVTAAMALSGCAPAPKTDTLTVWADKLEAVGLKAVAADFQKATGIKIDIVVKDKPREDFLTAAPTGKGPDVLLGAHDWTGELVANGLIAPIDLGSKKADFRENAIRAFTYDSKLYGMPYTVENIALVCNAAKVPSQPTWEQIAPMGVGLSLNAGGGDPYHMYPLQTSFGSKVFEVDKDGNYLPKVAMATGGTEFANWLATDGAKIFDTQSTWDSTVANLKSGKTACWITGPWAQGAIDLKGSEYKIYSIPSVGGKDAIQFLGSRGFFISATAKDSLYAQKFVVDYAGTEAVQTALFQATGRIPAHAKAFAAAASDPIVKGFGDAGTKAEPMPAIPAMGAVWASWGSTEVAILDQKGDPATLWSKMISDIEASIKG